MRVLVAGHLNPSVAPSLGFTDARAMAEGVAASAVDDVVAGILEVQPTWQVKVVPWGGGTVFLQALEREPGDTYLISAGRDASEWQERPGLGDVLIEMGHDRDHDGGKRILDRLGSIPQGRSLTVAASTSRPLLGLGSTAALAPDLSVRNNPAIPVSPPDSAALPGSGAGGGAAAVLADRGARLVSTGTVLAERLEVDALVEGADLVLVAHLFWHSPDLVDAPELEVAERAHIAGKAVAGIGIASSLSPHEMAEVGIHGLHLKKRGKTWVDLGRRVGRTWGNNFAT